MAERFSHKRSIEKCVFQDENDFTLEVSFNPQNSGVYGKGSKVDVQDSQLFHTSNRQSVRVMVSACVTWHRTTNPFFVNKNNVKVYATRYKKHLEKQLLPSIDQMLKHKDWIFIQDVTPSHHSNLVKGFLKGMNKK